MLTEDEIAEIQTTGKVPQSRMRALSVAFASMASDARAAAAKLPKDSQAAAALRGKAKAYSDASHQVTIVARGHAMHPRSFSRARALAVAYKQRQAARRAAA